MVDGFTPYFHQALQLSSSSAGFLKMLLRLQELPAFALTPDSRGSSGESEGRSSLSAKLKKVESLTLQDRVSDATKVLFSHGIAPPTESLFKRLQALHPPLKEPIPELDTFHEQFSVSSGEVREALFAQCTESWHSVDLFGWNTSLLHLIRGAPNTEETPSFFSCYCILVSRLVAADVSDLGSFLLSGGSIFGLNKESEEKRIDRSRGVTLPGRDLSTSSPDAIGALADCSPIQMGVGASCTTKGTQSSRSMPATGSRRLRVRACTVPLERDAPLCSSSFRSSTRGTLLVSSTWTTKSRLSRRAKGRGLVASLGASCLPSRFRTFMRVCRVHSLASRMARVSSLPRMMWS